MLGSIANLRDKTSTDYPRGIVVVKEWIREAFYYLEPDDWQESFLSLFLKNAFLGFRIDKAQIKTYINQTRCVTVYRPQYLLRILPQNKVYVLHELVSLMTAESPLSLNHGVLFIRCVLCRPKSLLLSLKPFVLAIFLNRR